jgi:hypothetical protein
MAGELLRRELRAKFWNDGEWKLEVTDEHGAVLFVLRFSAEEGPEVTRSRRGPPAP